ncbi:MAG: hypothetical protein E7203_06295 [Selenomonas ruminantium]|uniref:Thioredoxin domain-containing protein n=1 Tax=Selenomonas ruminantium TaxID=971 RepID=A0A927ZYZ3_SELRU|nr:hypothetical protein [Selenomonas ruminantium]MBE6085063.1 hypothetical protein [Selenomonas ruminantium]
MRTNLRYILLPLALLLSILTINVFSARDTNKQNLLRFPAFQTVDLNGNTVTNKIFTGRFTVVVLWVTKDENSRQLWRFLSDWQQAETSPIQIIGLVGDVKSTDDAAKINYAQQMTADFSQTQLLVNDDMAEFLTNMRAAPAICFVDATGRLVGQPVIGYEPELIKKEARRLLATDSQADRNKSLFMKKASQ